MRNIPRPLAARGARAFFILASIVALACRENSTSPAAPAALSIVSGGAQSTLIGVAPITPLVVGVTDQNGTPLSGVTVTWSIATGDGALSAETTATDSNGRAQVTYTPGATDGAASILAAVTGLTSVTFTVTVTAPASDLLGKPLVLPPVTVIGHVR